MDEYRKLDDAIIEEDEERYSKQFPTQQGKPKTNKAPLSIRDNNGSRPKTACCLIF